MKMETWRWETKVEEKGKTPCIKKKEEKRTRENENRLEMGDELIYVFSYRAKLKYFKIQMHQFYVSNLSFLHSSHSHFLNLYEINWGYWFNHE